MSETIADMVFRKSPSFTMLLQKLAYDKARVQLKDNEELLNIYLPALLIADESVYHMISDDDLLKYLKGAVLRFEHLKALRALAYCAADEDGRPDRYLSEMSRCSQVICRIQRECTRRGYCVG